jgi:hypothetical protein
MTARQQPAANRRALPAAAIFLILFASLWLVHLPVLGLPYFWDEAGYFIPAARDILLTGDLIPHSTLSNAHPPLVMLWLAACWKLVAYTPVVTRTAMLLVAAFGFTALWLLARRVANAQVATATVTLTALSPVIYSQSAMAQLDIAAFALVLWTLYAYLCERRWMAICFAALAAVAKETTVAVTLTLAAVDLLCWLLGRCKPGLAPEGGALTLRQAQGRLRGTVLPGTLAERYELPRRTLAQCLAWLLALLPLVAWYAYHFHRTGHVFGNPDYLRYNVGSTVTPLRIALSFLLRIWHVAGYMNLFVLTAAAPLLLWDSRRGGRPANAGGAPPIAAKVRVLLLLVVLAQVAEFSIVGGALLARYMVAAIPLVILLSVDLIRRYAPEWTWWIAGCAAAFVVALFFNPPWFISPEDNLTWVHFVEMHQQAARYVERHYPDQRILTAWSASDELNRPFLGYTTRPLTVVRIENFSAEEILRAAQQPDSFDAVVAFSTKFEPPRSFFRIPNSTEIMTRYYDFHQDLPAAAIAHILHGRVVWQASSPGEWIAVIEIDKIRLAKR